MVSVPEFDKLPFTVSAALAFNVHDAPGFIVKFLQTANDKPEITGCFTVNGIMTSVPEEGTVPPDQFDPVFQSVVTPSHVPAGIPRPAVPLPGRFASIHHIAFANLRRSRSQYGPIVTVVPDLWCY